MRIATGIGYDCHRLVPDRKLVIGGVRIEHTHGLLGHSDADVLTHAIIDALLGAAALGDIGQHFPDTDERYRDADSLMLLRDTVALLDALPATVEHVDATVIIEAPKLGPYREQILARLGTALAVPPERLNVKATRGEGMGFIGHGEGVAALAIVTINRAQ